MAIQFQCVACRQPIEVDDEMADQAVTCPYCRKVVTAPAVSERDLVSGASAARPAQERIGSLGPPSIPGVTGTNVLSWMSLGCISGSLICFSIFLGFAVSIAKNFDAQKFEQAEFNKALQEELAVRPGMQAAGVLGSCVFPACGVLLAIIALIKRTPPKWPAITSLAISGLVILLMCFGIMLQASQLANQGATP